MSVTVANLSGGAAFVNYNSQNVQFESDCTLAMEPAQSVISSSLWGKIDSIPIDLIVKFSGTPRYYDTAALATMFPYIGAVARGTFYGGGNAAAEINSVNGDQVILENAVIGKMPELILGMEKCVLGPMEIWGLIQSGQNPTDSDAYFTFNASGGSYSYSAPSVPNTAYIGQQEFAAAWGSVSGLSSFQGQETWTISHELELEPVKIQGRTRAFRLGSYRALAKVKPVDATLANILAAFNVQGSNAATGTSINALAKAANGGSLPNLVITGTSSMTITIAGAALVTAGAVFGSKPLRQGEIGFVSTSSVSGGSLTAPLALA